MSCATTYAAVRGGFLAILIMTALGVGVAYAWTLIHPDLRSPSRWNHPGAEHHRGVSISDR